jgi:hypothetical protein
MSLKSYRRLVTAGARMFGNSVPGFYGAMGGAAVGSAMGFWGGDERKVTNRAWGGAIGGAIGGGLGWGAGYYGPQLALKLVNRLRG